MIEVIVDDKQLKYRRFLRSDDNELNDVSIVVLNNFTIIFIFHFFLTKPHLGTF